MILPRLRCLTSPRRHRPAYWADPGLVLPFGQRLPVVGYAVYLHRFALSFQVHRRGAQPQIGQRDAAPLLREVG